MTGIDDKNIRILIVDKSSQRLNGLTQGVKDLGYTCVQQAKSLKGAIESIECDEFTPDWLITELFADDQENGLSFLALTLQEPALRNIRVSIILEPEESQIVRNAFELGAFSVHPKHADISDQIEEIRKVLINGERYRWRDPLIAAHFLRAHLSKAGKTADLMRLEKSIMSTYPEDGFLKIYLAAALHTAGRSQDALTILARNDDIADSFKKEATDLSNKIIVDAKVEKLKGDTSFAKKLDIQHFVIVDSDNTVVSHLQDVAKKLGVEQVDAFSDGKKAWEFLKSCKRPPDLIIQEWRLKSISGSVLLNRIRSELDPGIPIVVYSALVKEQAEKVLLKELGVSEVITKPLPIEEVKNRLQEFLNQDRQPENANAAEIKIRQHLKGNNIPAAQALFETHMDHFSPGTRLSIDAEFAFIQGKYQLASEFAIEAVQMGGEKLAILDLLGKIYMKLRMFSQSEAFFNKAREMSPQNISRLCLLAEVQAEGGGDAKASETVAAAKDLDADNVKVKEAEVKVALANGNGEDAKKAFGGLSDPKAVIGFMNNRAVSLANQGKITEGINLYNQALEALPEKFPEIKSVVYYNMGLALIKGGDQKSAAKALQRAGKSKDSPIASKINSLTKRLDLALKSGTKVKLISASDPTRQDPGEEMLDSDKCMLPIAIGVQRGEVRLHLIYQNEEGVDPMTATLVQTIPSFEPTAQLDDDKLADVTHPVLLKKEA